MLLPALLFGMAWALTTGRWCEQMETILVEEEVTPRQEDLVPCTSLYHYRRLGWRLDLSWSGRSRLCPIYKPPETRPVAWNRTVRACCPGWGGTHCTLALAEASPEGHCFATWQCQPQAGSANASAGSLEECCAQPWGHSWRDGHSQACLSCSSQQLPGSTPSPALLQPLPGAVAQLWSQRQRPLATCATWSGFHYRTFDGRHYHFLGRCTYLLAGAADSTWAVHLRPRGHCPQQGHCQLARVLMGPEEVLIQGGNVSVNGQLVPEGESQLLPGLSLQWQGDWLVLSGGLGVVVRLDRSSSVSVSVDRELQGQTQGLCGLYNGRREDDFLEPGGGLAALAATFGNSWRLPDSEPGCLDAVEAAQGCEEPLRGTEVGMEASQLRAEAQDMCHQLLDGPFRECHAQVPPAEYHEACLFAYCAGAPAGGGREGRREAVCVTLASYAQDCAKRHIRVLWRKPGFCERLCPGDQRYSDCASACPRSCSGAGAGGEGSCEEQCASGCECAPGLFWDGALCVPAARCPCYHRRQRYAPGDTVRQLCNPCVCQDGRWLCAQAPCPSECAVGGDGHYHTFDGRSFSFRGRPGCRSVLAQDLAKGQLSIVLEHGACDSGSCLHAISVSLRDTHVQLRDSGAVLANGQDVGLPWSSPEGLSVSQASSTFLLLRWSGAQVLWGVSDPAAYITLDPRHAYQVQGLCGTFTWNQQDDFLTPAGDVETSVAAFAGKFQLAGEGRCPSEDSTPLSPCSTHTQHHIFAEAACAVLHSPAFQECHRLVDREPFHLRCLAAVCGCAPGRDCLCPVLTAYARRCAQEGALSPWRNQTLCPVLCSGGQEYQECAPVCGRNCGEPEDCGELGGCVAGCNCPSGLLWDSEGQCVPPSLCPCQLGAHRYAPGSATMKDCNRCVCQDRGLWNCTARRCAPQRTVCPHELVYVPGACLLTCDSPSANHSCPPASPGDCVCPPGTVLLDQRCVPPELCPCRHGGRWYPPNATIQEDCNICVCQGRHWHCTGQQCSGRCQASGAPHYVTFDGLALTFPGACEYLLVREASGQFAVSAQNLPCGASGLTCTKALTVRLQSTVVHMLRGRAVTVNGASVTPPKVYTGPGLSLRRAGLFLLLTTRLGLTLLWDGGTRVLVQLSPQFRGRVAGLCGDFDGDASNDLQSRQGGVLEPTAELAAHSWRLSPLCPEPGDLPHPCTVNAHRAAWARSRCGVLLQPLFARCHAEVPPQQHYEWCVYDACGCDSGGDCECLCSAIAAYADECSRHGLHLRWRSQELCPLQCEGGQVYEACGPMCSPTCHDHGPGAGWHCQAVTCVEGCFCPEGTLLHGGVCLEPALCPCESGGSFFPPGTVLQKDCGNCTCQESQWLCGSDSAHCEEPVPGCAEGEAPCQESGHCVPHQWLCDNQDDCGDGSDEEGCATPGCGEGQVSCSSGHCLPLALLCDGQDDCGDGTDEQGCPCPQGSLACADGRCLPPALLCDGHPDCSDAADEESCLGQVNCTQGEVSCFDGTCVEAIHLCDGNWNCPDGADEGPGHCPLPSLPIPPAGTLPSPSAGSWDIAPTPLASTSPAPPCGPREFPCGSGSSQLPPCGDLFRCPSAPQLCLNLEWLCDGIPDCLQGEDELACEGLPVPGGPNRTGAPCPEYSCPNGLCIGFQLVCDGKADCETTGEAELSPEEQGCGAWGPWSPWGWCSHSCGPGVQGRSRHCSPPRLPVLQLCQGPEHQTQACFMAACPVDGEWTSWSPWSLCSEPCQGTMTRQRQCHPPQNGGQACAMLPGGPHSTRQTRPCPQDGCPNATCSGELVFWPCAPCPLTCDDISGQTLCPADRPCSSPGCWCPKGQVLDSEGQCVRPGQCPCQVDGARYWPGQHIKADCQLCICQDGQPRSCWPDPDCAVNCGWSPWSPWAECLGPCGSQSIQWSFRSPSNPRPSGRGRRCRGIHRKARRCQTEPCGDCEHQGQAHHVGERWQEGTCTVCQCLYNRTARCSPYCPLGSCPQGWVLVEGMGEPCCHCAPPGTGPVSHAPALEATHPSPVPRATVTSTSQPEATALRPGMAAVTVLPPYRMTPAAPASQSIAPGPFPPIRCSPGQVPCEVLGCVEQEQLCDGREDCLDGSDERRCASAVPFTVPTTALPGLPSPRALCSPRQLTCGSGECLAPELRCDLRPDCQDGSDEEGCVDCRLAPWSGWSPCSLSCGLGVTFQRRELLRPLLPGGSCPPDRLRSQPCFMQACPVAGAWTVWEAWGPCSVSCGGGHRSRQRSCVDPPPKNGGAPCPGASQERTPCGLQPCTGDTDCGPGRVHVNASLCQKGLVPLCPPSCLDPEANKSCSGHCVEGCRCPPGLLLHDARCLPLSQCPCLVGGELRQPGLSFLLDNCSQCMCEKGVLLCEPGVCPVPCGWSAWSSWSPCDRSCGSGVRARFRSPSNPPAVSGGVPCEGDTQELQACHTECGTEALGWTPWAPWSACSQSCLTPGGGPGWRSRSRLCPSLGNTSCPGEAAQEEPCSPPVCPVLSAWGLWAPWSTCSAPCDGGIQTRGRSCSGSAAGDAECQGPHSQTRDCNTQPCTAQCPGDMVFRSAEQCRQEGGLCPRLCLAQGPGVECTSSCAPGCACPPGLFLHNASCLPRNRCPCQMHGHVYEPGEIVLLDSCNNCTCVSGEMACTSEPCPVACGWSPWTPWSTCSRSCNVGIRRRFRAGTAPPAAFGGAACQGSSMEAEFCSLRPCQGPGAEWGPWSPCSVPCGGGFRNRTRGSGPNSPVDFSTCGLQPCTGPVPGVCSGDKQWLDCAQGPASCAELSAPGGTNQTCLPGCYCAPGMLLLNNVCVPTQDCPCAHGGRLHPPGSTVLRPCENCSCISGLITNCTSWPCEAGQPTWSPWTPWSECSASCGPAHRHRHRFCTRPAGMGVALSSRAPLPPRASPAPLCPGPEAEEEPCALPTCDRAGGWGPWGPWSSCSRSCGGGLRSRTRTCDQPPPQGLGDYCEGPQAQGEACQAGPCPVTDCTSIEGAEFSTCGPPCPRSCDDLVHCVWHCQPGCYCPPGQVLSADGAVCVQPGHCGCLDLLTGVRHHPGAQLARPDGCNYCTCSEGKLNCTDLPCPLPGGWCPWSEWTACSQPCRGQTRTRSRTCSCPVPQHGGSRCPEEAGQSGTQHQREPCPSPGECPVDGAWSPWGPWSPCDACLGQSHRSRACSWPPTPAGGRPCPGGHRQSRPCQDNSTRCSGAAGSTVEPVTDLAGGWGLWSPWSPCSRSCTDPAQPAWRSRSRLCLANCTGRDTSQERPCNLPSCTGLPLCPGPGCVAGNCSWTAWAPWEPCSRSCGVGQQRRLRAYHPPGPGGHWCPDILTAYQELRFCNLRACPVPRGWSRWSPWSWCDRSCGGGRSLRSRSCSSPPPKNGGAPCVGERHHARLCNPMPCEDGCPAGMEVVSCANLCPRRCSDLQEGIVCQDGQACQQGCRCPEGSLEQDGGCVPTGHCECTDAQGRSWAPGSRHQDACSNCTCQAGQLSCTARPCPPPIHCAWSRWSAWSPCSRSCGPGGQQRRFRSSTSGSWAPECQEEQSQSQPCPQPPCPPLCLHGDRPHSLGDSWWQGECQQCSCTPEGELCEDTECAVPGAWTPWSPWSDCPVSCGGGNQVRTRVCVASAPPHVRQLPCLGPDTQTQRCGPQPCGGLLEACSWGPWGPCSHSCGPGLTSRSGSCPCPLAEADPACNGTFLHLDTQACYVGPCLEECMWSSWSSWTQCSCQVPVQQRYRHQRPAPGGMGEEPPCTRLDGYFRPCLIGNCSEDSCTPPFEFRACGSPCTGLCATHLNPQLCQDLPPCQPGCYCPEGLLEQAGGCIPPGQCNCQHISGEGARVTLAPGDHLRLGCKECECQHGELQCTSGGCRGLLPLSGWSEWSPCGPCLPASILAPASRAVLEERWPLDPVNLSPISAPLLASEQHRHRLCLDPETGRPWAGDPDLCSLPLSQHRLCPDPGACLDLCQWSPWGPWSPCQVPCSGGFRLRWREAKDIPGGGCRGPWAQTEGCNMGPCPGESCEARDTVPTLDCANQCPRSCADLWDRVECLQGPCRPGCRCPPGQLVQDGRCVPISSCHCGLPSPNASWVLAPAEVVQLDCKTCTCVNGSLVCPHRECPVLGPWSAWSRCSAPCGGGTSERHRSCKEGPRGAPCQAQDMEQQQECNPQPCPECSPGQVLSTCATSCPHLCSHLWPGALCVREPCQLGCDCPGEQLLHNGTCVPPAACPCTQLSVPWGFTLTLEEQARELPAGTVLSQNCTHCICQGGAFSCSLTDCQECPPGEMWQQVAPGELGPCERTCQEPNATETRGNCRAGQAPGCLCRPGYFRSQPGPCVTADHCECWHHGRPHPPGTEWQEACESCHCLNGRSVCTQHCPLLTCAQGEVTVQEPGSCCPACHQESLEEQSASCRRLTELRNLTKGPCYLDQVEVSYCSGHCPSSTNVMPEEPYLQSQCDCCSYRLDPENPVRILSLRCPGGRTEPALLPVIHSCQCSPCQGGDFSER
ncbi:PREDICTED: SCO-spondin [Miniopterus natalensis]|uniref:SCO-spondin n=1 Tax=Miniopterus natalensis TaxID=291302 RepID=UPI0007A7005E|nr:PREDICTED: SCO-spondin [Miniopterus natalensis]